MRLRAAPALWFSALLLLGACAARGARPEHASTSAAPAERTPEEESRWREMTWAEYYSDVMERARKRGVMVVWINPPPVAPADATAAETIGGKPAPR